MTSDASLERLLVAVMADEATVGDGDPAIDRILTVTREHRPRPRWLALLKEPPMRTVSAVQVGSPAFRRGFVLAAVLALMLVTALAIAVGSNVVLRPAPLPAPFGFAGNGKLIFERAGDLYTVNADGTGAAALISGLAVDTDPEFSPDGTRFLYRHQGNDGRPMLTVARADGTAATAITDWPVAAAWSPDGRSIAVLKDIARGRSSIEIVASDGSVGGRVLDLGELDPLEWVLWRPPDGRELLFNANPRPGSDQVGVYAANLATGNVREVAPPTTSSVPNAGVYASAEVSPDGRKLGFWTWGPDASGEVGGWGHIRDIDTGAERISHVYGGKSQRFTPDGRFVIGEGDSQLVVEPVDGGPSRVIGPKWAGVQAEDFVLSPDGTTVYLTLETPPETWKIDLATGEGVAMPEPITHLPTTQRVAMPDGTSP